MSLLSPLFLVAGLCAAAIPILLHLLMRGKPKKVEFPALRFVRRSFVGNRRKYQLRHLLLLLLRAALLILLGLALSRPAWTPKGIPSSESDSSTPSNINSKVSDASPTSVPTRLADAPVAVALVIDTSVRMSAIKQNQTRLTLAQAEARAIISQLPAGSMVAIMDSGRTQDSFQIDLVAAYDVLEQLRIVPGGRSMPESVAQAIQLLNSAPLPDKELFILTDRTEQSWPLRQKNKTTIPLTPSGTRSQTRLPSIYLFDCGQEDLTNISILESGLTAEVLPVGSSLQFQVELGHCGAARDDTLELHLLSRNAKIGDNTNEASKTTNPEKADIQTEQTNQAKVQEEKNVIMPFSVLKAEQPVSFPEGDSRRTVVLTLSELDSGLHQGFICFKGDDILSADNRRWFTFEVRSDWKILIVCDNPVEKKSIFIREALAPEEFRRTGRAVFELKQIPWKEWQTMDPKAIHGYQAILLLDPSAEMIQRQGETLTNYVKQGGGLGLFLGRNAQPTAFDKPLFRSLLGAQLVNQVRVPDWDVGLTPVQYENLVLAAFRPFAQGTDIPWYAMTVNRYWYLTDLSPLLTRILDYTDGRPAVYSHWLGRGSVLVSTSPLSDLPAESPWNLWPVGDVSWIFPILLDGMARHLLSGGISSRNVLAGQTAVIRPQENELPEKGLLYLPDNDKIAINAVPGEGRFLFAGTNQVGPYFLESMEKKHHQFLSGFSVNYAPDDYNLKTLTKKEIDSFFGGYPTHWLDEQGEIITARNRQRTGSEFYSGLILLLAILVVTESIWSQRFYKE